MIRQLSGEVPVGKRDGDGGRHGAAGAVLLSRDRALVDHVTALAEAANTPLRVLPSPGAVPAVGSLVMVGLDVAGELPSGRRGGLLVVRVEGADPPEGVWRQAVQMGAERVVLLPEAEGWLVERLVDVGTPGDRAPVLAVLGGCGGAGASCLAIGLAVTAAGRGLRPVLIDADPLGGGLDLPLGAESVAGLRWPELPRVAGPLPAGLIGTGLPRVGGIRLIACPRQEVTQLRVHDLTAAMDAAARESDVVIVDLPRRIGDVEAAVLSRSRRVLIVVPSSVRASAAGALVAAAVEPHAGDVRVVVRQPTGPACPPEAVAEALFLPLQGHLPTEPGLDAALEAGEAAALRPRGPMATLARRILADVLEPR